MLKPFYFLPWTNSWQESQRQLFSWDEFTRGTVEYSISSPRVDQLRFPWWKFFSCWKVSHVKHFKEAFDWVWRDNLTFHYIINNDWFKYLLPLKGKNFITKLTCAPPYHMIITLSVYFAKRSASSYFIFPFPYFIFPTYFEHYRQPSHFHLHLQQHSIALVKKMLALVCFLLLFWFLCN